MSLGTISFLIGIFIKVCINNCIMFVIYSILHITTCTQPTLTIHTNHYRLHLLLNPHLHFVFSVAILRIHTSTNHES